VVTDLVDTKTAQAPPVRLGQPARLVSFSVIEMWERFGYNGMKAILVIYLTKHFLFDDVRAYGVFTAFASLAYLTPFLGGLLADRILGFKRAVRLGALLSAAGYFVLALSDGPPAQQYIEYGSHRYRIEAPASADNPGAVPSIRTPTQAYTVHGAADGTLELTPSSAGAAVVHLEPGSYRMPVERSLLSVYAAYVGLSLVIIGTGFFKPNNSSMVGRLYEPTSPLRDAGFSIFYMGLNIGSLMGQLLLPYVRRDIGFTASFSMAGAGMLIAFVISILTDGRIAGPGADQSQAPKGNGWGWVVCGIAFVSLAPLWLLLQQPLFARQFVYAANAVLFCGLVLYACLRLPPAERNATLLAVILTLFSVVFWALFEQSASSMTLYADRNTDRTIFGWNMPPDQIQFLNPLFIILLTPAFNFVRSALAQRRCEPDTVLKFAIGTLCVAMAFLTLVWGSHFAGAHAQVALGWLAAAYLLHTMGELCISPIGLAMITRLSAPRLTGVMMGMWFLSGSLAQAVGGMLASLTASSSAGGDVLNPALSLSRYAAVFNEMAWTAVAAGLLLLAVRPLLNRLAHHA
jgi:POT family proton-dependent oligopeptide transporter